MNNVSLKVAICLVIMCVIFGVIRFNTERLGMPSHELSLGGSYQALAHVFVGGLVGAYLATRERFYGYLAVGMTLLEVVAFFASKV